MKISELILPPLIGGFIGWLTNYLAILMLFRPYRPLKIGFLTFQGVIPKRHWEIAKALGELVEEQLLSQRELIELLTSEENKQLFAEKILLAVKEKLSTLFPVLPEYLRQIVIRTLLNYFKNELPSVVNKIILSLETDLQNKVKIGKIVEEKVLQFDLKTLEKILTSLMKTELSYIEVFGGVIGFIIGIIQVMLNIFLK
ncbi:DUF445 domain-containing protein [Carboxydothermus hydrogenoformans]|uniref:DUF445 domain-containing protein n=1 Tax=Carboxydothermus hydrogenoformans (strain ATCC BAA-161 / DSM 6008 / Z-2901) TaxID=246194 RepID=Q3ABS5_CARHZ|nr:DUF445 family protein [Carboxydothermus hydrogenoformans]ABB14656.1 conserved hypothetical protein [Carboxydothermus hydrogenoformans Z-2901]